MALSKLVLEHLLRENYDRSNLGEIIRAVCNATNDHAEGKISARYQAQSVVPGSSVAAQIGDITWDLNCTVRNGTVGGAGGPVLNYVRLGWVCTVSDPVTPTWQEMRIPTG